MADHLTLVHDAAPPKILTTLDRLARVVLQDITGGVPNKDFWAVSTEAERERWRNLVRALLKEFQDPGPDMEAAIGIFLTSEEKRTHWRVGHASLIDYLMALP